ncbi:hypothetical protein Tco_0299499 [Tanacetum coccineum]
MEYCENEDDSFTNLETDYPAIVFDDTSDTSLSCKLTVSPLDNNKIDFKISFDESDDEDYMVIFDENSFSCKIISVDNLEMDSENENDKVNTPSSPSPEPTIRIQRIDMAPLPHRDLRHPWLRYQVEGYDEDFAGLTDGMRQTLGDRLSMVYIGDDGQALFTSHAWRRLFEVRGPLVREFMLEFFSTCRMSDTEMGLDVADTLCFRCRMTWRQFILALGLHTEEEMVEAGFRAYWSGSERVIPDKGDLRDYCMEISFAMDFLGPAPSYVFIRDPVRRLCHKMIACRGQAPEKVIGIDLFYLCSMYRGTANVLYLLMQYLFRHAEGRKRGAKLSGGHFIGRLAAYFRLVYDTWARVAPGPERQQAAATGAPGAVEDAPAADEGAQAVPTPVHLIAPFSIAHGCPTRGVSDLGQAMSALLQLLTLMTSPTLDLSPLLS